MINVDYDYLKDYIDKYVNEKRCESAAFLTWYLVNYYRLDESDAIFCICDERGDKGIDGIYINESAGTIDIFQCKLSHKNNSTIGDTILKEFYGTLSQLRSKENLQHIVDTAGDVQLVTLIKRLDLINKISAYDIRGVFLSNLNFDSNGDNYLKITTDIKFVGKDELESSYISDSRTITSGTSADFNIDGYTYSKYNLDSEVFAVIAPVKASELVQLSGISDQSLFDFNVRGPLGNTQVNKDIVKSIKDPGIHKNFPLFHNGITIICNKVEDNSGSIHIETYYVVNGCQSLTALYNNQRFITDDLRVLTKFVQVGASTELSKTITKYSNNQNGVKARDFKSNHPIQIRLQKEISTLYNSEFFYEIKKGETPQGATIISNEDSGIHLWSFDLKQPWNIHRKYQIFDDKYVDLFARPEVNADRIIFLYTLNDIVEKSIPKIQNASFAKYSLTRYAILFIIRNILENDTIGKNIIENPKDYVRNSNSRDIFIKSVRMLIEDIMIDINGEIEELGENFDYKSSLRDENWVKELSTKITASYLKLTNRGRISTFSEDFEKTRQAKLAIN
jgi:hypothetical protein